MQKPRLRLLVSMLTLFGGLAAGAALAEDRPETPETPTSRETLQSATTEPAVPGPRASLAEPEALFDSIRFHVGGADSFTSQHHTDLALPDASGRNLESFAADDFRVDSAGWRIDQVEIKGQYFNGDGPAASVNVYVLADAGGFPSSVDLPGGALAAYEGLPFVDGVPGQGDLMIPLVDGGGDPAPLELGPGTYWLVVQVDLPLAQSQWGWTAIETSPGSGEGLGSESAWLQNFPGFGPSCVEAWGNRIVDCNLPGTQAPPHPDLGFILRGERLVAVDVPTLSFPSMLTLCGLLAFLAIIRLGTGWPRSAAG